MSKKFQRFLSLVTALIMALYSVPVSAFASENVDVQVVSEEVHTCEFALTGENAPTCTEAGSKTYACSCGNGYSEEISAIGHSYSETVTAPTCTADGSRVMTCSNCGDTVTEKISATGHSYSSAVTTEATCAQVGVITYTCSACNDSYTEEIPMIDHSYETVTVEATCTEAGKITSTCTVCGAVTEEEIPALEHNFEEDLENSIEATCTEEGSLVKVCTLCGEIETEVVEMAEHEYVDGICSVCGAIDLAVAVKAGPAGTLSSSLVDLSDPAKIFISAEITGLNATESVVIKLYDANGVHLATTTLLKPEYYTASLLGVNIIITGDSSSWSTVWEADKLRADYVPAYAELYVDGVFMNQANVPMVSTNGEAAVNWAEVPGVPAAPLADPVAMIGDQGYASLQEALDAAKGESNIVINLMKDATLDIAAWDSLAIGGDSTNSITINGNGKQLTFVQLDSDWTNVITKNGAKLTLKDMMLAKTNNGNGSWNNYGLCFNCDVELNNVTSQRALIFSQDADLKNVTVNESGDYYAIWVKSNGQTIDIDGLTINSAGRGIKIDDQYVDNPGKVDLTVKDATFSTAKKAAIMVKSAAGANIFVDNVDISNVKADSTNVVWNDEDAVADYGEITVTGGTLGQEGNFPVVLKDANGNVKGFYKTLPEAVTAAQSGDVVTITTDGTYTLPGFSKELTIKAEEGVEAVVDNNGAVTLSDAKVTFENLIFDYYPNDNYVGLQHIDTAIYNNCTFNGQVFLYGNYEEFNNCTFNQESSDAYNVWTYGAKEVEFNECTFNSAGKAVLVYNEGATANHVVFNNSELIATSPVEGKAAVEIDTSLMPAGTEIEINNTTATNFAAGSVSGNTLWNDKKDQTNLSVSVDSEEVWPVFVAEIGDKGYTSLQAALADAQPGDTVVLLESITADTAVDGTDVIIDLNTNTLTLTVGGNNFFGTSTIKNGTIDITGCVAGGDCIIGIGDYSNDATLTLDDVNIYGNGYSSAYAVLYVYKASTLNINGGSVVVSNEQYSDGGVIKAQQGIDGKINIVGTESDPVELTFNNAKIGMLDGTVLMEYVDLDITGGANAINQSALTVKHSSLTIKDCDGRALTLNDGDVTIENSTLDFSGATEGEIRYKKALTLKLVGDTDITGCDIWSDVEGAKVIDAYGTEFTVSGTEAEPNIVKAEDGQVELKEKPKGTITYGYTGQEGVWGEGGGNAKKSLDVELYVGVTKIATASLNNIGGIIDGDVYVTWSIPFAGSTDEYWTVEWAEGYPSADAQPTKVVMIIDGEKVAENDVVMNAPDNLNPVVWKDLEALQPDVARILDANGNVLGTYKNFESAIAAAVADANVTRLEVLCDYTQAALQNPGETYALAAGQYLTIGAPAGENYTVSITRNDDAFSIYQMENNTSLTIASNVTLEGLDIIANGFATSGNATTINGNIKAQSLKQWTKNNEIVVSETGSVWLGYGDGQFDLAYGNGSVTVNGTLTSTADLTGVTAQFKAGYSGTRGDGNTLNLNDTYFEAGAWFNLNGSNGTINVDNSVLMVSGGDSAGKLAVASTGNNIVLSNGSRLVVGNISLDAGNKITLDSTSKVEAAKITGAGTIVIDATGMNDGDVVAVTGDLSGFTGTYEVINNNALEASLVDDKIVLSKRKLIEVTYADGTVELFADMLDAVPYTTNYPKLEGATVKLLGDIEAPGIRMMENDMVLDLNDFTYTITAGTGSQGTNTSGFQIRPEITTVATIKNGTIKVAEGAPVVWMFNVYASDFVVEDVTVDCTNMAYSYGESCYVSLSREGDNVQFTGNTTIVNFNADVAGNAINVGDTMTIADTVEVGGTIELDAGAELTAKEGLTVVAANEGYAVGYSNGVYTVFLPTVAITDAEGNVTYYATIAEAMKAAQPGDEVFIYAGDYTGGLTVNKAITPITVVGETDAEGNNLVNISGKLSISGSNVTVKNLNVSNPSGDAAGISGGNILVEGCQLTGSNGLRYCYANDGDVTLKDCVITGGVYGVHFDGGNDDGDVIIDGCTITGWTSFGSAIEEVRISDTEFKDGNYDQLRFFQNAEVSNCTFPESMNIDFGVKNTTAEFNSITVEGGKELTDILYIPDIVNMGIKAYEDGVLIVVEATVTDSTGDVDYFLKLTDAVEAAQEGDLIKMHADVELTDPIALGNDVTLSLNGNKLTGNVVGKLAMAGGTYITAEGHNMVAPTDAEETFHYLSDDGVFVIEANGDITFAEGDVKLGESWRTLPGQKVTVAEGAIFTVPAGMKFEIRGNATVNGTLTIEETGEVVLADASATLTADEGLNVTTNVADHKVVYEDDMYKLVAMVYVAEVTNNGVTTKYESLQAALDAAEGETDIVIDLLADATLDITAWDTLAIGGETTKTITINGNRNKLTFNQLDSDWNNVATNNNAKLILNDMTIANSGYNNGPWNRYDINFGCDVKLNNVTSEKALAFKAGAVLKNVTINESGDNYAIWIQANGQTVSIDGLNVASVGRGIKIDEQYVDAAKVDLTVKNATFDTQKKGAIMVKSAAGADITLENVDISNAAADTVNAVWNDEDAAAYFGKVSVTGDTLVQEGDFVATLSDADDKVQGYYKTLQAALDACTEGDNTVTMLADLDEDVTIKQVVGVNVTIDGAGKTYTGTMINDSGSRQDTAETLTIKNVNFETAESEHTFIDFSNTKGNTRYPHNVAVENCTFTATDAAVKTAVAMRFAQGKNISVSNCSAEGLHSAIQSSADKGLVVDNLTVNGCKHGIAVGTSTGVVVKNSNITTTGYGIRADGSGAYDMIVEDCTIEADMPIVIRKNTGAYQLTVNGSNSFTAKNEGGYQVIFTNGDDGEYVVPTGAYVYTPDDANSELVVYPDAAYVAQIGETKYISLAEAVAAAEAGDTITVIADVTGETVTVDRSVTITGEKTLTDVSITANGADVELTVSELTFAGNSWINSGTGKALTVSGVSANVAPSNTNATNSRSAFIALGRSEQTELVLTVENSSIVVTGGGDPILGWAAITSANIIGNTFGAEDAYINNADAVKFMSIADDAVFNISENTVYSNYNGFVFSQNTTRDNAYTVNVDKNTFNGSADHIWVEVSGAKVTHATINATSDNTVNGNAFTAADIKTNVTTWTSYAGVDAEINEDGKLIAGTFTAETSKELVAEGYVAVDNEDGTWTVIEASIVDFKAIEISFESALVLKLKFIIPDEVINNDSAYIVLTEEGNVVVGADEVRTITMAELREQGTDANGRFVLEQQIASGEMTGDVTVHFYDGDGNTIYIRDYVDGSINTEVVRTAVDYCRRALTYGDDKIKKLVTAMVTYGGYSQKFFGVDADNPAYDALAEFNVAVPDVNAVTADTIQQELNTAGNDIGIKYASQKVLLDSILTMATFFTLDDGASITDYDFMLTYTEGGREKQKAITPIASGNRYRLDIEDIPVAYWDYMYKITVTEKSTGLTYEVNSSVLAWAKRCIQGSTNPMQIDMAKSMYYYNDAANQFFGK